ncbi:MAG: Rrf2 family transcriptional regulator [Lachnospiraceae bacterium]|nr:Rrf2 family transcriptional regulator [Lachnospiraceae bacterium]
MISTKGRYALRMMIDLAEHREDGYIPLKDIATRQGISKKYLEIIVKELVNGKLLSGVSGKGGGYMLCREPKDYKIGEILELLEGSFAVVSCLAPEAEPCDRAASCKTLPLWKGFYTLVHEYFYSKTLEDIITGNI